ncbi:uncharacterized protein LOC128720706 [Anopheles nili]|uniref:uncharacterized protein LOC128720706 n=1 Tax=Anopheles nili TaxID=185578 RepID=UPI00237A8CA9|nr:uncharacterized protein LOC128720706 [Anopheles nili]
MANMLWSIIWLLVLVFVAFFVSFFCAWWYVVFYPLTVCVPNLSSVSDLLLKGAQFTHYCAKNMMEGNSLS